MELQQPWQQAIGPDSYDYTQWQTTDLQLHIRDMVQAKEAANQRKADELERQIGHVCFELTMRQRDYMKFQEALAARSLRQEAAC